MFLVINKIMHLLNIHRDIKSNLCLLVHRKENIILFTHYLLNDNNDHKKNAVIYCKNVEMKFIIKKKIFLNETANGFQSI